jgi:carbon monoxide dehydrogenase subunit G
MVDLEGTYTFNAPRDLVWEALMDPQVIADILPGCETMEEVEPNSYRAVIKIKVGPVQGNFEGTVRLSNIQELGSYHMDVSGRGAPGFVTGAGDLRLEPQGNDTLMTYKGTASVGGKLAGVGQRLLDSSAKFIVQQGLDALNKQIQIRAAAKGGGGGGVGFG